MREITSLGELRVLQGNAITFSIVLSFLIFLVAYILASRTPYEQHGGHTSGRDCSYKKRRRQFAYCVSIGSLLYFLFNIFYVRSRILYVDHRADYILTALTCLAINVFGTLAISYGVMLIWKNSKFATILWKRPSKKLQSLNTSIKPNRHSGFSSTSGGE